MFEEALKVYGLKEEHVFAYRAYPEKGEVVIVTHAGKKIRHRKGAAALFNMTERDKTGKSPKPKMLWAKKIIKWSRWKACLRANYKPGQNERGRSW